MASHIRVLLLSLLLTPAVSGCLQIELYGPVASATITITRLRGGAPVTPAFLSNSRVQTTLALGTPTWLGLDLLLQLLLLGGADVPADSLADDQLYLVQADGGRDLDYNEDKEPDQFGELILGRWHAVMTGAQLKMPLVRVNLLTEAAYQALAPRLDNLSDAEVLDLLDELARRVVTDINNDGDNNYLDVLSWSTLSNRAAYTGPDILLQRLARGIDFDTGPSSYADNGTNAVYMAGWKPAVESFPYSTRLLPCVRPILVSDLCSFRRLPLIGQETNSPDIADIMSRVLVSHDWMADRFEALLLELPDEILLLMRSLAIIVIDADTRPAYYDSVSAAIFLDADFFWLTDEERQTVSTEEDYRAAFASQVAFSDLWRYTMNNDRAFKLSTDLDVDGGRALEDIVPRVASLLFHELAHAADFFPPSKLAKLSLSANPAQTVFEIPSDRLRKKLPLRSPELSGIADVLFQGATPSNREKNYKPAQIGEFFSADRATDLYAYNTQFEDLAMLFEELMMAFHFGFQRDVGFSTVPPEGGDDSSCSDYQLEWGERGRIGNSRIKPRARQVLAELLPDKNYAGALASLPPPASLPTSGSWCDYLDGNINTANQYRQRRPAGEDADNVAEELDVGPRPYL